VKGGDDVRLPRTERPDAPAYLARYQERRLRERVPPDDGQAADDGAPLYLRQFRARRSGLERAEGASSPAALGAEAWAETIKSKEIIPASRPAEMTGLIDIHLVRHGETQGYSVDGGLTPMGGWQSRRRGHDLSKGIADGDIVRLVCAPTARAVQTAEQVLRGIEDGLATWGRSASVQPPETLADFRNFDVWSPATGLRDPTGAFREFHAVSERYERVALGDRPLWLVEMDRFWRLQAGGGDPIAFWMTVPLLTFEPPAAVVQRFWAGMVRLASDAAEGTRFICCTHSGPMRAVATWALGYDPGEPYNTEEVRIRVRRNLKEAVLTFRNRTQEVQVPAPEEWPVWWQRAAQVAEEVR
jgi:broad specificity phosphatase PhoE